MRTAFLPLALSLAHAAHAAYTEFFFATEESDWKCPNGVFDCPPPQICAHDSLVDKYYCCGPGGDAVCWTNSMDCNPNALECGEGEYAYCCLDGREMCTQRTGQINVCWATADNPVAPLDPPFVNETFSSLYADDPSATTIPVELEDLTEATTTAVSSTTASSSPTESSNSDSDSDSEDDDDTSSLSAGAIAGVVIGAVAGTALLALLLFFLYRRNRNRRSPSASHSSAHPAATGSAYDTKHTYAYAPAPVSEIDSSSPSPYTYSHAQGPGGLHEALAPPVEMDSANEVRRVSEMEGSRPGTGAR